MSKQKIPSAMDSATKSRHVVEPYQPVWMAHWMRQQGNASVERSSHGASGNVQLNHVPRDGDFSNALDASRPVKESKTVEAQTFGTVRVINEITSKSAMNHDQETDKEEALRQEFGCIPERGKALDRKITTQLSSWIPVLKRECDSAGEGTSKNHSECVKAHPSTTDKSLAALKPFKETFPDSSTHVQPHCDHEKHELGKGKAVVSPLLVRPSVVSSDQEHCCKYGDSTDLICERNMERDLNKSFFFGAPSTSKRHPVMAGPDSFREMQKCSGIPLLPSQFIASEQPESKKSHYNFYSVQKLPNCGHDMETMRICTTVDSVEATAGGFPRFSKTIHSLLITKKTDANIPKEVYGTTQLITDMDGNTSRDIHSLWPFSGQGSTGVKLQPLSSSSNSEDKINVEDAKDSKVTLKNESSADTDIMDMDFCKEENSNPGANSNSSPTKDFATTSREVGRCQKNTWLPDINLELPALPEIPSPLENTRASSSRTQSLEIDTLAAHSEQPKRKLNPCFGNSSETDPIMRWVKRLKLRSSPNSSSQGKKTPVFPENSSADKMGMFFRKILDSGIGSSKPTNHPSEESAPLDNNGYHLSKYKEDLMIDAIKKDKELLFSHTWIKRWLQDGSKITKKNPEMGTACDPKNSKSPPDEVQNKEFPSIAAMALMGKALNGLQSCDLQKQGSFTVWNTQGILKKTN